MGFVGVMERCLEKSFLMKCIKKCHETDTHVENNVKCRGIAQKSRKLVMKKMCTDNDINDEKKKNKIMSVEPKGCEHESG